jgi:hypothetical protein
MENGECRSRPNREEEDQFLLQVSAIKIQKGDFLVFECLWHIRATPTFLYCETTEVYDWIIMGPARVSAEQGFGQTTASGSSIQ